MLSFSFTCLYHCLFQSNILPHSLREFRFPVYASVYDSQALDALLDKSDSHHELYADSAYSGERIAKLLSKNFIWNRIHEKGYSNTPLTEARVRKNRKSQRYVRA